MADQAVKGCPLEAITITKVIKKVDLSDYKGIWVIVEHFDEEIKNTGFQLISKANRLAKVSNDKVTPVLVSNRKPDTGKVKRAFAEYGVKRIKAISNPDFTRFLTEDAAQALSEQILAEKPDGVLVQVQPFVLQVFER